MESKWVVDNNHYTNSDGALRVLTSLSPVLEIRVKRKRYDPYYGRRLCGSCARPFFCDHEVVSQLNGNNGEVTNSDDRRPSADAFTFDEELERITDNTSAWFIPPPQALRNFRNGFVPPMDVYVDEVGTSRHRLVRIRLHLGLWHPVRVYGRHDVTQMVFDLVAIGLGNQAIEGFVAFLNGANGEATNSDDVDGIDNPTKSDTKVPSTTAAVRVAMNKRLKKEAETSKHRKNPGTKHGPGPTVPTASVDTPSVSGVDDSQVVDFSKLASMPAVLTLYCVTGEFSDCYHDGRSYHEYPFAEEYPPDLEYCKESGPGYVIVSSKSSDNGRKFFPIPAVTRQVVEGYKRTDQYGLQVYFPEREYIVCEPFLSLLRTQLNASILDGSLFNACLSISMKAGVPFKYGESTAEFYAGVIHRRSSKLTGSSDLQVKIANNGCMVGVGDMGRIDTTVALGIEVNTYSVLFVEDEECDVIDYNMREDFWVLKDDCDVFTFLGSQRQRPMFSIPDTKPKRRGLSKFFSFRGKNQPGFVEYGNSANNLNQGMKRLFGARDGEAIYRENAVALGCSIVANANDSEFVRTNKMFKRLNNHRFSRPGETISPQYDDTRDFVASEALKLVNLCSRSGVERFLDTTKTVGSWAYYKIYDEFLTASHAFIPRTWAAEIPHIKRALRRQYVKGRELHTDDDLMVRKMQACIKRELAKFGKAPRLYVQYGAGAMYANELPEFLKACIDGLHVVIANGYTMGMYLMSKPRDQVMDSLFTQLKAAMSTPKYIHVIIFSDDSCVAGQLGGSFGYNVDISSNDSSQDVPAFLLMYMAMANFSPERAEGLIEQCMLPMKIGNPQDSMETVLIQFAGPFEGSGTTLTTGLNFFANACNYLAAFHLWSKGMDITEALVVGASLVGHQVTVDSWGFDGTDLHKAQFLKRSPVLLDGQWTTQVNLGCILRSLGSVEDELVARQLGWSQAQFLASTMEQRMEAFFSAVIAGWVHESGNSILNALRTRFNSSFTEVIKHDSLTYVFEDFVHRGGSSDDGLYHRYGLTQDEIDEAVSLILNIRLGMHVSCTAFAKIYHVDYGLPLPEGVSM